MEFCIFKSIIEHRPINEVYNCDINYYEVEELKSINIKDSDEEKFAKMKYINHLLSEAEELEKSYKNYYYDNDFYYIGEQNIWEN